MNDEKKKRSRKNYAAARKTNGVVKQTAVKAVTSLNKKHRKHTVLYVRYTPQGFTPVILVHAEGDNGLSRFQYRDVPAADDVAMQCPICIQTIAVNCSNDCLEIQNAAKTVADNMCQIGESLVLSMCPSMNVGPTTYAMKLYCICSKE